MQFSEILKLQSDSESESFSDGQSFLNKLEGSGLDNFSCDLKNAALEASRIIRCMDYISSWQSYWADSVACQ